MNFFRETLDASTTTEYCTFERLAISSRSKKLLRVRFRAKKLSGMVPTPRAPHPFGPPCFWVGAPTLGATGRSALFQGWGSHPLWTAVRVLRGFLLVYCLFPGCFRVSWVFLGFLADSSIIVAEIDHSKIGPGRVRARVPPTSGNFGFLIFSFSSCWSKVLGPS